MENEIFLLFYDTMQISGGVMTDNTHDHGGVPHIIDWIPKETDFQIVSDIFKLLGDSSRLRIFWLLCHIEENVTGLSTAVDMSSPAVSHHLKLLKASGLIVSRKDGKEVYYKAADTARARMLHISIEEIVKIACPIRGTGDISAENTKN